MNDFITEIKDDIKRERYEKLFYSYGKHIVGISIVIVISVALGTWYKSYNITQNENAGDLYRLAIAQDAGSIVKELDYVIENATDGYKTLALFTKAKQLYRLNKYQESLDIFNQAANDAAVKEEIQHLAKYQATIIMLNHFPDRPQIEQNITDLTNNKSPYLSSIKEMQAILLYMKGQIAESIEVLKELIQSSYATRNIKSRAERVIIILEKLKAGS